MKIQGRKSHPQTINPIIMFPNENFLEELPNKEFRNTNITMFRELREDL